mgnify:CR=1 FL=1
MSDGRPHRNCEARIDLGAIRANYEQACRLAPDSRAIAVVKADGYGHGAVDVTRALGHAAPAFAVGILDEGLQLRDAGITEPVLVLEGVNGSASLRCAAEHGFWLVVHDERQLHDLEAVRLPAPVAVWLKIDTGMHRLGLAPDAARGALDRLRRMPNCAGTPVACTHLATSDEPGSALARRQVELFDRCIDGMDVPTSIANSGAILALPDTHRDWNRPGYMLYGGSPFAGEAPSDRGLKPAMTLVSEIIAIRDVPRGEGVGYGQRWTAPGTRRIATVAIGYADGYPRHAPDGTPTLVRGRVAPLAGTVSMDLVSIDVSDIDDAAPGDEVVLWGPDLPVDTVARAAGTIGYELLTGVSMRVPRRYFGTAD